MAGNIYIETQYWPAKCGEPKRTLVVTIDRLHEVLKEHQEQWVRGEIEESLAETIVETLLLEAADTGNDEDEEEHA